MILVKLKGLTKECNGRGKTRQRTPKKIINQDVKETKKQPPKYKKGK